VRERMWWWLVLAITRKKMWSWIALFSHSYHTDILQCAKRFFDLTSANDKILHHGECENILSGYLCVVTIVFSMKKGISIFEFPEGFGRSLSETSHLS
jgi:hypothetical protein